MISFNFKHHFHSKLKIKILLSVGAIVILMMLVTMLAVSWVIRQQYQIHSASQLNKASQTITHELAKLKSDQQKVTEQIAMQANLASTMHFLSSIRQSGFTQDQLFEAYADLANNLHKIGYMTTPANIAVYDESGKLTAFALLEGKTDRVGYVHYNTQATFQVAELSGNEMFNHENFKSKTSPPTKALKTEIALPKISSVAYIVEGGMLALESRIPIETEVLDAETSAPQRKQVGAVVIVKKLDLAFVHQLSKLTSRKINLFIPQGLSLGELPSYQLLNGHNLIQVADENNTQPPTILLIRPCEV